MSTPYAFGKRDLLYDDLKDFPITIDNFALPYSRYPMEIELGQVFIVDYYLAADGSLERQYWRFDGNTFDGEDTTSRFVPDWDFYVWQDEVEQAMREAGWQGGE